MMNLGLGMQPSFRAPMQMGQPGYQLTGEMPASDGGGMGRAMPGYTMGYGGMPMKINQGGNAMQANLAALYAAMGQQHGGVPNFMDPRMIGGGFPRYSGNGYDSSGINPHGMYGGGPQLPQAQLPQMQFPQNPGGFMAMRNLGFGGR